MAAYLTDWRGAFHGDAIAVVRPSSAHGVASVVRYCAKHAIAIVPQGGNTGLAAGATPLNIPRSIVLSVSRLRSIRPLDLMGNAIAVDAGCVLADVQAAAKAAGKVFPLSLAAEGTAQIGGLIATNAGGTAVLKYGTMRALVLGLEVVLPDGTLANGMRALRKDNAGYDWKQVFIGSEGTLGVITGAVLRVFPRLSHRVTALLSFEQIEDVIVAFSALQTQLGDVLLACEFFSELAVNLRLSLETGMKRPMTSQPWYVLVEAGSSLPGLHEGLESALGSLATSGPVSECIVASSTQQAEALWAWRESISDVERRTARSAKHDVSVPISAIPAFIRDATVAAESAHAGARVLAFGHVGDGNVHFNVLLPDGVRAEAVNETVHAIVRLHGGSITAEHGIGRYRKAELAAHAAPEELDIMRRIKSAIDPDNRMNPGAVL
ncbi:MAG: FAD-binding oxidoreductase [Candidatus Eremiobacteraeota bacterium]|nr:FAD-binding oxidoreductase [Candidatus Eremiobacteraeota bacterium]